MVSTRAPRKRPNSEESPAPAKKAKTKETRTPKSKSKDKTAPAALPTASPSPLNKNGAYPRKQTLFDDLDAVGCSPVKKESELQLLKDLDDDESSLTSLTDEEFEDVPLGKDKGKAKAINGQDEGEDEEDEDIEFENVEAPPFPLLSLAAGQGEGSSGDLELTLNQDTRISLTNPYGEKKGPSKIERLVRSATHCAHVQALLWHNSRRNAWLCDPEVQGILLSHIPSRVWDEVDRWRRASGLEKPPPLPPPPPKSKHKKNGKGKQPASRPPREWGQAAARLEEGVVDMSHGDPLFRLMRVLSSWWKQRFRVTAPGIRKTGYISLERLDRLMKECKDESGLNPSRFGERIPGLAAFRIRAQELNGSRDVGAQLFTALLRGLGLEARMVASLQPLGFGWNKMEDADPEPEKADKQKTAKEPTGEKTGQKEAKPVVEISDDSDEELELAEVNSDNDSVVVVPEAPKSKRPVFDADLQFPHYWTEVLSPATHKHLPVDVLVKNVIATNRELVESLEPRGAKADKARQVLAYVVGFSADGTAKDVTVRYLKRQTLPGRTKGVRFPISKVPVYNKHGKVKRYDLVDWFKMVMRGYGRGQRPENPITEEDEQEDATDLSPCKPEKKEVKEGEETLQYYKQSKEFVLARHLKREEALVADAVPVKVFRNKKTKKNDTADVPAENVYLRKDVVAVKSAETWHKQGRAPKAGEEPLKLVPYRAATINRRREISETEAATGEKVLQGLYSFEQTAWIIPAPIQNGIIPKNEYGNIDLFVEHMCPQGAVHVPYRGAVRVCRRLGVDFAEAVIDFEFGHRMAVPVIQGVVVAEEHHDRVMEELAKDEAERQRKEDEKRRAAALGGWRKMLMGLRIVERIRQDYGEIRGDERVFGSGHHVVDLEEREPVADPADPADPDMAGGFLPEGYEYEDPEDRPQGKTSSFFPVHDDEDNEEDDGGDPDSLVVEES